MARPDNDDVTIVQLSRETKFAFLLSLALCAVYWVALVYLFGLQGEERLDWDTLLGTTLYLAALGMSAVSFWLLRAALGRLFQNRLVNRILFGDIRWWRQ
jgi:hypothetical protein